MNGTFLNKSKIFNGGNNSNNTKGGEIKGKKEQDLKFRTSSVNSWRNGG